MTATRATRMVRETKYQSSLAAVCLTHSSHCLTEHYSDCEECGVRNVFSVATAEGKTRRTHRACVAGGGGHAA
jgi:hypothetical protein